MALRRRAGDAQHHGRWAAVPLAGVVSQGVSIDTNTAGERIEIPSEQIEADDLLYRVGSSAPYDVGIRDNDLLIVERRRDGRAATAELVLAEIEERVFVGRWWAKHGRQALMDAGMETIVEDARLRVLGAVTVIVRPTSQLDI